MTSLINDAHAYSLEEYVSITKDEQPNTDLKPIETKGHNKIPNDLNNKD